MSSYQEEYSESLLAEVPDEAPEADVLEQYLTPTGVDLEGEETFDVPVEADPADVRDQRAWLDDDDDDYR